MKTESGGRVFRKSRTDGAGRLQWEAVSYDLAETSYAEAMTLEGDAVWEETR